MLVVLTYAPNQCYTKVCTLEEYLTSEHASRDPIISIDENKKTYTVLAVDCLHMNPGKIEELRFNQHRKRYVGIRGHVIGLYDCSTIEGISALMWSSKEATDRNG